MGMIIRGAAGRRLTALLLCVALATLTNAAPKSAAAGKKTNNGANVSVTLQLTDEVLHNPDMGWVLIDNAIPGHLDAGRTGTYPEVGNVAVLTHWGELEPVEGQYDWALLDQAINYWSNLGKRIHFRISTDAMMISGYGYAKSVPEWLFDEYGVPYQERFDQGYSFKLPDYTHPVFMKKLETFLIAFADRYKNDARLDIVDLRGYGTWGEWHSGHDFGSYAERIATLRTIINKWYDAWEGKKILALSNSYEWRSEMEPAVNNPQSYEDYLSWSAFDHALTKPNLTFRRDGAAGALREYDVQLLESFFRSNRNLPLIAEFFGGYGYYKGNGSGYSPDTALEEALQLHPNYITIMGHDGDFGAASFYAERPDLIDEGNRRMGYRLVLNQAEYPSIVKGGGSFELKQLWSNTGTGRSYNNYPLKLYLTDAGGNTVWSAVDDSFDLTGFVAGEVYEVFSSFSLPASLAPGNYQIRVALVDAQGSPAIQLGIAGRDSENRYPLGSITVTNETVTPPAESSIRESFESGSFPSSKFVGGFHGAGALTSQAEQIISGQYSAFGSAPAAQDWTEFLYSDTSKIQLEPATTYTVSFKYKASASPGPNGFYYFLARTGSGSFSHDKGFTTWRDDSGASRYKTVTFTTDTGYTDYYLIWGLRSGGAIAIDDIVITKHAEAAYDSFESGDIRSSRYEFGTGQSAGSLNGTQGLHGSWSVSSVSDERSFLYSRKDRLKLSPNSAYLITFRWKTLASPNGGGTFRLASQSAKSGMTASSHRWAGNSRQESEIRSLVVHTGKEKDFRLVWGLKGSGDIVIDDINVIKLGQKQ
ncbi:DUF4832 domain-containing protein [Paenibacillus sp. IITD108]|uniref:DUF4832 domain-containing protein n=1 Tax=Paenibacillus sp. IITD108 TaxID=3116649 RepID=UPI002F421375